MSISEKRIEVLEHDIDLLKRERALLDERILLLQQQIAEQKRLSTERELVLGQAIEKKFDTLMYVIVQHANTTIARFDAMDQRFSALDTRFSEQKRAIQAQFE